jgi:hypothetical protein
VEHTLYLEQLYRCLFQPLYTDKLAGDLLWTNRWVVWENPYSDQWEPEQDNQTDSRWPITGFKIGYGRTTEKVTYRALGSRQSQNNKIPIKQNKSLRSGTILYLGAQRGVFSKVVLGFQNLAWGSKWQKYEDFTPSKILCGQRGVFSKVVLGFRKLGYDFWGVEGDVWK